MSIEVYFILAFLGVPVFFFCRWVFRKFIHDDRKRGMATWIGTLVLTPVIYAGLGFGIMLYMNYYPSRDFDRQQWLNDREKRYELSEDLIESKMLIGKTKAEVGQLLGSEENLPENDLWTYYVGFRPPFQIDPDVLDIEFQDGKVVTVRQHGT
jgi:hypothetical protein